MIWPLGYKKNSCSTQLSAIFQLLIKTKILTNEDASCLSLSNVVFIMLINVKIPTIVGIHSDIHGSDYKIEYEYSSLPKSLDRNLFFSFFFLNKAETRSFKQNGPSIFFHYDY